LLAAQSVHGRQKAPFSAVLQIGASVGGPASGLADQFRQVGYDDPSPCFFFCHGTTPHPSEDASSAAVGFTIRYPVGRSVAVGGGLTRAILGGAAGYRSEGMDYIFSRWNTSIAWAGGFWIMDPGIRLGGGPAWYRLDDDDSEQHTVSRMGLLGEVGLEFPANRTFFLDLAVRLNVVPATDVDYSTADESVVRLRPSWTHVQLQAGFGIHLWPSTRTKPRRSPPDIPHMR